MNKNQIIIISSIVVVLIAVILVVAIYSKKPMDKNIKLMNIKITTYSYSEGTKVDKEIIVNDKIANQKLQKYIETVANSKKADSKLAILREVIINFEDSKTITIQTSVKDYCYYKDLNNEENNKLVAMPEGLLELTLDMLNKDVKK